MAVENKSGEMWMPAKERSENKDAISLRDTVVYPRVNSESYRMNDEQHEFSHMLPGSEH